MLFAVMLVASIPQMVTCLSGSLVAKGSTIQALSEAWQIAHDIPGFVKAVAEDTSKFFSDVAAKAGQSKSSASSLELASKLLAKIQAVEKSLKSAKDSKEILDETLKKGSMVVVGKCVCPADRSLDNQTPWSYMCNDANFRKCVVGGVNPKPELEAVWKYYNDEGLTKRQNSLCKASKLSSGRGSEFFTKAFKDWNDPCDYFAEKAFRASIPAA